ncbi:hypothetical protein [Pseudomonas sp. NS1(2017)]|uniref:hypothetical protein n=1 Tax=Pseudomonas sp. NS1(2017) TaxID=2025658 RepID=UPI001C451BC8|nr:hypothetical protein [Pseudomonas sp. NS1(2017)]
MTDNALQEPAEEITQSFAEFLENSPPNQHAIISDLVTLKWSDNKRATCLKTPEIQLHCTEDSCNGIRFFRCTVGNDVHIGIDKHINTYLIYRCANCQNSTKTFSIAAKRTDDSMSGMLYKFGEAPTSGPPTQARLLKLIGPDRDIFLKGRRCENQGLGIGAFVYYRRVVENQKDRTLKEIKKVLERLNSPNEKIETLNIAINETQFSKALEIAKQAIPESLLINGHNPLKLYTTH